MQNFMNSTAYNGSSQFGATSVSSTPCKKRLFASSAQYPLDKKCNMRKENDYVSNLSFLKPSNTKRNERERKRVRTINDYFSKLQKFLPNAKHTKKLSKVETLKAAIDYIEFLQLSEKHKQKLNSQSCTTSETKINTIETSNENAYNKIQSVKSDTMSSSSSTSSSYSTPTSPNASSTNLNYNQKTHINIQTQPNKANNSLCSSPTYQSPKLSPCSSSRSNPINTSSENLSQSLSNSYFTNNFAQDGYLQANASVKVEPTIENNFSNNHCAFNNATNSTYGTNDQLLYNQNAHIYSNQNQYPSPVFKQLQNNFVPMEQQQTNIDSNKYDAVNYYQQHENYMSLNNYNSFKNEYYVHGNHQPVDFI